jgi:hypothetical protein
MSMWVSIGGGEPFQELRRQRCDDHASRECDCGGDDRFYAVDVAASVLPTVRLNIMRRDSMQTVFGMVDEATVYLSFDEALNVAHALRAAVQFASGKQVAPVDWDGLSHCVELYCRRPATHRRLLTFSADAVPVVELVCCEHAQRTEL